MCNPFLVVHDQLLCLTRVEGEIVVLEPHCQVSDLPIGYLIILDDQAYHRCVGGKLNDGVLVVREQRVQEGTMHAPLRGPSVEDQHGRCIVSYDYHLGQPAGSPASSCRGSVLSLLMSFEGTMVLNAEL